MLFGPHRAAETSLTCSVVYRRQFDNYISIGICTCCFGGDGRAFAWRRAVVWYGQHLDRGEHLVLPGSSRLVPRSGAGKAFVHMAVVMCSASC